MESCEAIMEFDCAASCLDSLRLFKIICAKFAKTLEYVGGIRLGPVKEKLVRA